MNIDGMKIFASIMIFLALISLVVLTFANKKPKNQNVQIQQFQTQQNLAGQSNKTGKTGNEQFPIGSDQVSSDEKIPEPNKSENVSNVASSESLEQKKEKRRLEIRSQWESCKNSTLSGDTLLMWNVAITEGIPEGGSYAKGYLDSDLKYPVRIVLKPDGPEPEKVRARLIPQKMAFLKANCKELANDGSVVVQAY